MGGQESKIASGGSLQGAVGPAAVPEQNLPPIVKTSSYSVRVPERVKRPSDGNATMVCLFNGERHRINIPRGLRAGDSFKFTRSRVRSDEVFTSTLPSVPGLDVLQSKPIVWGSVSYSFGGGSMDQQSMGSMVGKLLRDAQEEIIEQVVQHGCNACLGMAFNVTNDSSGKDGNQKLVIVTACGTPCVVVHSAQGRAVEASAVAVPNVEWGLSAL